MYKFVEFFILFNILFQPIVAITGGYRNPNSTYVDLIVSLRDSGGHVCGGSLLAIQIVITAAHCFRQSDSIKYIVLAKNRLNATHHRLEIEKIVVHPDFNSNSKRADIALVYLMRPVNHTEFLPLAYGPQAKNAECTTLGWGHVHLPNPLDDELVFADFTIASTRQCFVSLTFYKGQLCFHDADDKTKSVVAGDYGGPLICNDFLTGIISYSYRPSNILLKIVKLIGMAAEIKNSQQISYATDIAFYENWIVSEMDKLNELTPL